MTILVTGSPHWSEPRPVIERLLQEPDDTTIIECGMSGAGDIAQFVARLLGWKIVTIHSDTAQFGQKSEIVRDNLLLDMKPDLVISFGKKSEGLAACVWGAQRRGIPVEYIEPEN